MKKVNEEMYKNVETDLSLCVRAQLKMINENNELYLCCCRTGQMKKV